VFAYQHDQELIVRKPLFLLATLVLAMPASAQQTAPKPVTPTVSSDAVDKGGLLITVVVSKTSVQGEPLTISVEMKNTLKREVRLYASTSRWDWRFEPSERPKGFWGFRQQFAEDRVISGTIQPGKSLVKVFTTRSNRGQEYRFAWTAEGGPVSPNVIDLPVGQYRLTVGMKLSTFSRPTNQPEPWEGELTTKPVEFKVVRP
jgi:hypothetical protein